VKCQPIEEGVQVRVARDRSLRGALGLNDATTLAQRRSIPA